MDPKLNSLSPILWTKDIKQTISFYETILGFKKHGQFPNFVSLSRDNVEIMFVKPTEETFPQPKLTGNIFITTDRVDEIWETLKDKVTIKEPIADRAYLMRDFSIFDNNGYEIVFGEDISRKNK
jgi:catechol 2,3-dioxygenase-like lactoylglutathione lyase family enzyme